VSRNQRALSWSGSANGARLFESHAQIRYFPGKQTQEFRKIKPKRKKLRCLFSTVFTDSFRVLNELFEFKAQKPRHEATRYSSRILAPTQIHLQWLHCCQASMWVLGTWRDRIFTASARMHAALCWIGGQRSGQRTEPIAPYFTDKDARRSKMISVKYLSRCCGRSCH
jgi:hypothetical protein